MRSYTNCNGEIARSSGERECGRMYRKRLEPGQATRFLFARRQPLTFSMRNTPLFLDMNLLAANRPIAEYTEPISNALCRVAGGSQNVVEVAV